MTTIDDIAALVKEKNKRYGDSISKSAQMLEIMCPKQIGWLLYDRLHFAIRILDKLCRIMSPSSEPNDVRDAFKDICGYSFLALEDWDRDWEA